MKEFLTKHVVVIAWIQSIIATLGSLYYSEILHFTPCVLCWYQRILLYPLVLIIAVGILRKDKGLYQYVLPMSILGLLIALSPSNKLIAVGDTLKKVLHQAEKKGITNPTVFKSPRVKQYFTG